MKKILILITFLIFNQSVLYAELPYYVDFKFILNNSDAGKKAQSSLKSKLENGMKNVRDKEKKILEEEKKNNTTKKNYISRRL